MDNAVNTLLENEEGIAPRHKRSAYAIVLKENKENVVVHCCKSFIPNQPSWEKALMAIE